MSLPTLCALSLATLVAISVCVNAYLAWETLSFQGTIEQSPVNPPQAELAQPKATLAALSTEIASLSQATTAPPLAGPASPVLPIPTVAPAMPAPVSHPMADYTIKSLKERSYPGGTIHVRSVLTVTDVFTRFYIDYPSDGLTITGIMQVPPGDGPFPVVILNHGYVPRRSYWPGADTWNAAGYLNQRGYLTIAPDFRSWGESDEGNSFFSTGQVIDALNLISSLPSIPEADLERVGMWGHSMGGGVTTKAITTDPRIKAAVLYAAVSADDAEVLARWGTGCKAGQPDPPAKACAGAEVLTSDIDGSLYLAYLYAVSNPQFLHDLSPIHYFDWVTAPVQIHIGTADTTTPPEWSADIHRALQAAGKDVEYFTYPGQGHTFEGQAWRIFMERVADFFDRYLVKAS